MSAKQYLKRIRSLDKQVLAHLEQIEILHTQATKITAVLCDQFGGKSRLWRFDHERRMASEA